MGVDHDGTYALVAQQFLHGAQAVCLIGRNHPVQPGQVLLQHFFLEKQNGGGGGWNGKRIHPWNSRLSVVGIE